MNKYCNVDHPAFAGRSGRPDPKDTLAVAILSAGLLGHKNISQLLAEDLWLKQERSGHRPMRDPV